MRNLPPRGRCIRKLACIIICCCEPSLIICPKNVSCQNDLVLLLLELLAQEKIQNELG